MARLQDYNTQDLIAELKQRGFEVYDKAKKVRRLPSLIEFLKPFTKIKNGRSN